MTNQQHSITPPPELVEQWWEEADKQLSPYYEYIATQAARWGSDQELAACCKWLAQETPEPYINALRAARRLKPKSQAEEALEAAQRFYAKGHENCSDEEIEDDFDIIRAALERLRELEGGNG